METFVRCPECGGDRVYRVERKGILERYILPRFSRYPWNCKACKANFYSKQRGGRRKRNRYQSEDTMSVSSENNTSYVPNRSLEEASGLDLRSV
jgi:ssDNA-binding Zn-finger/Zn-ribbon topoisomerase 1